MTTEQEIELLSVGFAAVEKIWAAIRSAQAGKLSADTVIASLTVLHDELDANNKAADEALAKKFP